MRYDARGDGRSSKSNKDGRRNWDSACISQSCSDRPSRSSDRPRCAASWAQRCSQHRQTLPRRVGLRARHTEDLQVPHRRASSRTLHREQYRLNRGWETYSRPTSGWPAHPTGRRPSNWRHGSSSDRSSKNQPVRRHGHVSSARDTPAPKESTQRGGIEKRGIPCQNLRHAP